MNVDTDLLTEIKHGNEDAFRKLVEKYKPKVFNTIYSIMGDTQDMEDIAQNVFIQVYTSINSFKEESSISTWIYRITVNKCIDELRKRKIKFISYETELISEEKLKLEDIISSKEDDVVDKIDKKELGEIIQKILDSLPEKYRIILTLKEIDGLSYKEISEVMNISISKVKIWLFRARQQMKNRLSF